MPNEDGVILGGKTIRGFSENTMRGYPLKLPLTTRQMTDVVMYHEDILCAKGGRHVPDDTSVIPDPEERREAVRKLCALRCLDGYPDTKVIDPTKENYPTCTMPLSSTSPIHVTPEIMRNQQYVQEYLAHVALVRELLDQASLSTNSTLLALSNNRLYQSLGGLLKGALSCDLTGEPTPAWNLVRVLRTMPDAELVRQTTKEGILLEEHGPSYTSRQAVLKYRLHIDAVNSAYLEKMDKIDCGWAAPLPRMHHYDGATGFHTSLGPDCALKDVQYWVKQDGTTAKAASPAPPPMPWSNSVQGLTQHFEQMSMRNAANPVDMGHIQMMQRQRFLKSPLDMMRLARSSTQVTFFQLMSWFPPLTVTMGQDCRLELLEFSSTGH